MLRARAELAVSVAIFAAALALFAMWTWNGTVMNGDEATYALFARDLRAGGDWLHLRLGGAILYQRPPLYPWLLAASTAIGGESIFALRLPSVLFAAGSSVLVYRLGRRVLVSHVAAVVAALIFPTLALTFRYARAVVSDATLSFFVLLAIELYVSEKAWAVVAAGAAMGAALMTKQIVGFLPLCAPVVWAVYRRPVPVRWLAAAAGAAIVVAAPWHAILLARDGRAFLDGYLGFNVLHRAAANLLAPTGPGYYLQVTWEKEGPIALVVLVGVALAAVRAVRQRAETAGAGAALLLVWLVGTFAAFSIVSTRIDYYVLPAYPAFALLMALPVDWLAPRSVRLAGLLGACVVVASVIAHLPPRLRDVDRSPEIASLGALVARETPAGQALIVIDDLPFAPELYAHRPVILVVTRRPNFERLQKIELFGAPGNMVQVPAEELAGWLHERQNWLALEPTNELKHPLPEGARVVARTPQYVLYGR